MRNVDFQIVHTQTPAVERSYLTRQAQVDNEQRQATTVQQQVADAKMREAKQNPQLEGPKIQLQKEKEEKARRRKKKRKAVEAKKKQDQQTQEQQTTDTDNSSGCIDIRI